MLDFKAKFRELIKVYLAVIKAKITEEVGKVSGQFIGSFATVADFPASGDHQTNDWLILSDDDGTNFKGHYTNNGTTWEFTSGLTQVSDVIATSDELAAGTVVDKAPSVKQLHDIFDISITDVEATADWDSV